MIKDLWNIGLKVTNLDREVAFMTGVGAEVLLRDRLATAEGGRDYAVLTLGGTRMLLFESVIFEDRIQEGVRPGLTHAVYEVDDLDGEYARIRALGAEVLIEPKDIAAGFGSRRIAFFRSPGGFVFEIMQVVERAMQGGAPVS
ncbi:MAG: VOC family protein [Methylobacteriaceae bacterium]|nr:VOC family protein [Methylobacteriaceae bacterium]